VPVNFIRCTFYDAGAFVKPNSDVEFCVTPNYWHFLCGSILFKPVGVGNLCPTRPRLPIGDPTAVSGSVRVPDWLLSSFWRATCSVEGPHSDFGGGFFSLSVFLCINKFLRFFSFLQCSAVGEIGNSLTPLRVLCLFFPYSPFEPTLDRLHFPD